MFNDHVKISIEHDMKSLFWIKNSFERYWFWFDEAKTFWSKCGNYIYWSINVKICRREGKHVKQGNLILNCNLTKLVRKGECFHSSNTNGHVSPVMKGTSRVRYQHQKEVHRPCGCKIDFNLIDCHTDVQQNCDGNHEINCTNLFICISLFVTGWNSCEWNYPLLSQPMYFL